jgi:hypothetical protein
MIIRSRRSPLDLARLASVTAKLIGFVLLALALLASALLAAALGASRPPRIPR